MTSKAITRRATDADIPILEAWLREEYDEEGEGFYCNWNVILRAHERRKLIVAEVDGAPIGLLTDFSGDGNILTIKPDMRGRGYGSQLVRHKIRMYRRRGQPVVRVHCSPETSLPFWQHHGFKRCGHSKWDSSIHAYRLLDKKFALGDGPRIPYKISFYADVGDMFNSREPFAIYAGEGEQCPDGSIRLQQRAICFNPADQSGGLHECAARIEIAGSSVFEDKLRYEEADAVGFQREHAFFIDRITLPQ